MTVQGNRGGKNREELFPDVEARLETMFRPVAPRNDYVNDLERRLILSRNQPYGSIDSQDLFQATLLVLVAVLGGTALAILGLRFLLTFLGGLGILSQISKQNKNCADQDML